MKLANTWAPRDLYSKTVQGFHDEVEEHDEVDETKDGCWGVKWQQYVLTKARTSYKQLHELAREVKGVERKWGKKFTITQHQTIFGKWEATSRRFLRPGVDYFTEFLAKLDCVTVPKGETLQVAFERARLHTPPGKILQHPNKDVQLFTSLCRELQELAGDQPFMICQQSVANLFGNSSHRTISNWV